MKTLDVFSLKQLAGHISGQDGFRESILQHAKEFKTSWVRLGQTLYTVWKDKMYYAWGYDKFEHYTQKELGLRKDIAMKLLKNYYFLEREEPAYLKEEFSESRPAVNVPACEAISVLRLAKQKKELLEEDYKKIHLDIFEKGKDAGAARKDLTALIKERKIVDPEEEREKRNTAAVRRLIGSLKAFVTDMESLKLVPAGILKEVEALVRKLELEVK